MNTRSSHKNNSSHSTSPETNTKWDELKLLTPLRTKLNVPPLRERGRDMLLLAEEILKRLAGELDVVTPRLTPAAEAALTTYRFPGNVRELENILERAMTLCENDTIAAEDLRLPAAAQPAVSGTQEAPPPREGDGELQFGPIDWTPIAECDETEYVEMVRRVFDAGQATFTINGTNLRIAIDGFALTARAG